MRVALALARRGLGRVWPNPAVGCVLVRPDLENRVVGRGWTQPGGRPHAETEALRRAGRDAAGATAYVTLEPCAHSGKTGPCAEALAQAAIGRCVIALQDPDSRVAGQGIERLRAAGIKVDIGCRAAEAERLNAGFLSRIRRGRPWVGLKIATSLDGMIATSSGRSQWITGAEARARGHLLRARFDAILTGTGTVRADDPQLTCRLPGLEDRSPLRVVMAGASGGPSAESRLAVTAGQVPTWFYMAAGGSTDQAAGKVEPREVTDDGNGRPDPAAVLADLAATGITRVLVEAGPRINAAFMARDLVDELHWFRAPRLIGGDGLAGFADLRHDDPQALPGFVLAARLDAGADTYEVWHHERTEE